MAKSLAAKRKRIRAARLVFARMAMLDRLALIPARLEAIDRIVGWPNPPNSSDTPSTTDAGSAYLNNDSADEA